MLNKVLLIGNVGAEPVLRRAGGRPCATFHLATHRAWSDPDGTRHDDTQWHPLVFWAKQAERAGQLLHKGQLITVEGRLNHTSWLDREDPEKVHYRTEVVVQWFRILSPISAAGASTASGEPS